MPKNEAAQTMARARWAKTTPSERQAYGRKMAAARWAKVETTPKAKKRAKKDVPNV